MASDRRRSEDQDIAEGKLCGWHRSFVQKLLTMAAAAEVWWHNAATPFEQGLTDSDAQL